MYRELLIGCGNRLTKDLNRKGREEWSKLTRLDIDSNCNPDILWDLNVHPLPIADNEYDEIHAYHVLEHLGRQGDYRFFLTEFSEYWRILKPGGHMFIAAPSPSSVWAWGDPGHTRIISPQMMVFLDQDQYDRQIGNTAMTDYRWLYKACFKTVYHKDNGDSIDIVLKAVK